ncbi:MAG TPA: tRNA dihydrouridine(20/20a) synthase DusA [Fibrobacteria bacterium]|nr:tRNA dihydrouridine(20/20a) synthase DusA [Fibrobacteria bacterium]
MSRLSVAPMMDWTDRHCRFFLRLMSRNVRLYTEMVTTGAILHGKAERLLAYDPAEHPIALQLGGSDPAGLAACAKVGERFGYDEINLNVGCPSDRVQEGKFGACLMAEPDLVAACVRAMREAVYVPVTVKTRIGIDDRDSYGELIHFIGTVSGAGCDTFIIHARKAWLQGLSPKENRTKPPLRYDVVGRLKADFPALKFVLNGGITSLDQAEGHLKVFDGVMLGRAAYENPYLLAEVDGRIFGETGGIPSRAEILEAFKPYVEAELKRGQRLHSMTRHILGLFQGVRGGRIWRRYLSENACLPNAGLDVLDGALRAVEGVAAATPS